MTTPSIVLNGTIECTTEYLQEEAENKQTPWIKHLTGGSNDYQCTMFLHETSKFNDYNPLLQLSERISEICPCVLRTRWEQRHWSMPFLLLYYSMYAPWETFLLVVVAVNIFQQEQGQFTCSKQREK